MNTTKVIKNLVRGYQESDLEVVNGNAVYMLPSSAIEVSFEVRA
jgi:hypothetical protein